MTQNSLSVVIPCRNEVKYIERCTMSILEAENPFEQIDILVCDGMSDDGTRELVNKFSQTYPQIKLVDNPDRLTPFAMNAGIRYTNAEYILIMGAHSEISSNYLATCKEILDANPLLGGVGGVIENVYENEISQVIGKAMSSKFGVGNAHFRTGNFEGEVDTIGTPLYKRKVLEQVGLFDTQLPRNQDDELNFRIKKAGYKLWLTSKASFKYYVRASFKKLYKQYFQYGYWKVLVNKKHRSVTTLRQLAPMFWVLFVLTGWLPALLISPMLIWPYIALIVLYISFAKLTAWQLKQSFAEYIQLIICFFILHWSYGWGYVRGIIDFLILGKSSNLTQTKLSR